MTCFQEHEVPIRNPQRPHSSAALSRVRGVRGLLFDMGDVLYDATLWRRWLLQVLARMGIHTPYRDFYRVWDRDYLPAVHCGRREYHEAFCTFLTSLGLAHGVIDEIEAASQARRRELIATLRPLPGVRPTLAQLQADGMSLAVLSDSESPAVELRQRLEKLGIDQCFRAVFSSRDLGEAKPAALGYQTALAALQLPAAQVAFVGHDAEELAGATAAGMPTIAFNYDPDVAADLYLERFEELLEVIERPVSQLAARVDGVPPEPATSNRVLV
jgi:HAD superfamily hydrolase (TIGR01509 family)